jgi:hypothetical protein
MLAQRDFRASDLAQALESFFSQSPHASDWSDIARAIRCFDYKSAHMGLQKLLPDLGHATEI